MLVHYKCIEHFFDVVFQEKIISSDKISIFVGNSAWFYVGRWEWTFDACFEGIFREY